MKVDIPLPCPNCGGQMYSVFQDNTTKAWQICKECDYEQPAEKFKKSICCE